MIFATETSRAEPPCSADLGPALDEAGESLGLKSPLGSGWTWQQLPSPPLYACAVFGNEKHGC